MTGTVSAGIDLDEPLRQHRRELHVHCYRMLASFEEAEDAVQETAIRAWRGLDGLDEQPNVRAWLYRIATNVCLDALRSRRRRPQPVDSFADVPWLQPYPDRLLDEIEDHAAGPDDAVVRTETIGLSFLAALQSLPPRQRAALIARDLHGWSAAETAAILETSVPAANSALQRARAAMHDRRPADSMRSLTAEDRALLDRFIDAHERGDAAAAISLAAADICITMPPAPMVFRGVDGIAPLLERAFGDEREGDWRLVPTSANRQPAAASYLRRHGDTRFRAFKLDVLEVRAGAISQITTFGWSNFARLGLPETLDDEEHEH